MADPTQTPAGPIVRERLVRLVHTTVGVPDPEATAAFLCDGLGFMRVEGPLSEVRLVVGDGYGVTPAARHLVLVPADGLELQDLSFLTAEDGVSSIVAAAEVGDIEHQPLSSTAGDGPGVVVRTRSGLQLACRSAWAEREKRAVGSSPIRPRRLGHVNVSVPDPGATAEVALNVLGMRLSERVGELLWFLRIGTEHHNLGIRGGADGPATVHHVAVELPGWDAYRTVCDHLVSLGHTVEYGPGRHGPGANLFVYVVDPSSGLRIELFADMAHIDDHAGYAPPHWKLGDRHLTVNQWGPAPPQSFLQ